ncbi:nucleotide-binding protein [Corynebacterium sp. USCH3]|uniref:nucleotide-binding protein n=1 Tax=Corynebacterium sp. USCH3 TaxID=3024840 RepID=UPI0030AAB900
MADQWQTIEGTGWIPIRGFGRINPRRDNVGDAGRYYFTAKTDDDEYAKATGDHITEGPETWHYELDQPFTLSDSRGNSVEVTISLLQGGRYGVRYRGIGKFVGRGAGNNDPGMQSRAGGASVKVDRKIALLGEKIAQAKDGYPDDFELWRSSTESAIRLAMGEDNPKYHQFTKVKFKPIAYYDGINVAGYRSSGVKSVVAILNACQEELRWAEEGAMGDENEDASAVEVEGPPGPVFIVHGHDDGAKFESARVVAALVGSDPTILHEQANYGMTILEKFEHAAALAGFALVLLTADDVGRSKGAGDDAPRGRQNVVFELGYFFGRLGRNRTAVLYDAGVELPTDVIGVAYISRDPGGGWRQQVARELQSAGYTVDWSALSKF